MVSLRKGDRIDGCGGLKRIDFGRIMGWVVKKYRREEHCCKMIGSLNEGAENVFKIGFNWRDEKHN